MKTEKNIFLAFVLNLCFSILEFFGGIITGSVAIISDAIHDIGDAASIGMSYFFERKSKKQPDNKYTYGYIRFSMLGSVISALILLFGSILVIFNACKKIITPLPINHDGMIIFAIIGVLVNGTAAHFTRHGDSLNQKTVNLHMLEDVLGWIVVLLGAIVIKKTNYVIIDPIISICVAIFIIFNVIKILRKTINLFLEITPDNIDISNIVKKITTIDNIIDVHHIHVWSLDGHTNCATMHIVTETPDNNSKNEIKQALENLNIKHSTLEFESVDELCTEKTCGHITNPNYSHHTRHH